MGKAKGYAWCPSDKGANGVVGARRQWRRYREVAKTLARHGFSMLLGEIGLSSHLPIVERIHHRRAPGGWAERVPGLLAELGPSWVKIGQLASTRTDVLPSSLVHALETLQDHVPPFEVDEVVMCLEDAWQRPIRQVLADFNPAPLAAASIGQVHQGTLYDGQKVVIKVRRPGIMEKTSVDLSLLRGLADLAQKRTTWGKQYQVRSLVDELTQTLRDEMDFLVEARNTEVARAQFSSDNMVVPHVHWDLTRPDVLVLEEVHGRKISDCESLPVSPVERRDLAQRYIEGLYQQIFVDGFFHADPHPGNVHVGPGGILIWLDWGLVGVLSPDMRWKSVELVMGLTQGRSIRVVNALLAMGVVRGDVNRSELLRDVERLRLRYYQADLSSFRLGDALADLLRVARRHDIRIPVEYVLLARAAVTADGVVRKLDPQLSLVDLGRSLSWDLLWNAVNPQQWVPIAQDQAREWWQALRDMPKQIDQALETVGRGEIHIILEHKNLDKIMGHWERFINRLALSFLLAALVIGTGMVVHRDQIDSLSHFPFGEYAFIAAALLAIWVIVGAVRRGKL